MPRLSGDTGLSVGITGYRTILTTPGAATFFSAAAVARLGAAMTRLAVLWAVHGATGSFAVAGVATALFAVAQASVRPQVSRLVDRYGQSRVLPWVVALFAVAIAGLIVAAGAHFPAYTLVVASTVAGATSPQVAAFSAARWRYVIGDPRHLTTALSLEGALNDVTFLCGPSIVSTLSAVLYPAAGLTVAGALVVGGMALLLVQHRTEPPVHSNARQVDRRVWTPAVVTLFLVNLFMGFFFGAAPVVITAFAFAHNAAALAGPIGILSGVLSLSGGVIFGALSHRVRPINVMFSVSVVLVIGTALLSAVPNIPAMFVCYGAVGGVVALVLVPSAVLLQQTTATEIYTQANTWMSSASAAGIAISAPLTGLAAQLGGWRLGWLAAATLTAALPVTIAVAYRKSILATTRNLA